MKALDTAKKWHTDPHLWDKVKPLARQKRHQPTPAETRLWECLRNRQVGKAKFRRQHSIDKFIVDFYCGEVRLVVEVDGPIHEYTVDEDAIRQEFLESLGFTVLRFTNDEVLNSVEYVIDQIVIALETSQVQPDSPSLPSGEGARG